MKRCGCCGKVYAPEDWLALPFVGTQSDTMELLELRNCPCGSTLAKKVGPAPELPETIAELWLGACRQQVVSALTRKGWDACERRWRLLAEAEQVAGNEQNVRVYLKLADEAAAKHLIQQATW